MCTPDTFAATGEDTFFLDTPALRQFIGAVDDVRTRESDPRAIVTAIRPHFAVLLADQSWLTPEFSEPKAGSGMGSGIGMWLLYRAGDCSLALSALVVPAGAQTPVHDHLAWGLVGLYRGTQAEDVYQRVGSGTVEEDPRLVQSGSSALVPGDMYDLHPENDIHRVRTTSPETSVSLHLLGNDNGCIWRHRFFPEEDRFEPFKSGWLNVPCEETVAAK